MQLYLNNISRESEHGKSCDPREAVSGKKEARQRRRKDKEMKLSVCPCCIARQTGCFVLLVSLHML